MYIFMVSQIKVWIRAFFYSSLMLKCFIDRGETLTSISRYYGVSILQIAAENDNIVDIDFVLEGERLNIPVRSETLLMVRFFGLAHLKFYLRLWHQQFALFAWRSLPSLLTCNMLVCLVICTSFYSCAHRNVMWVLLEIARTCLSEYYFFVDAIVLYFDTS